MYYTKCCISNDKSFEMKKIIPHYNSDLNMLPINRKILLFITNKEIYIYPNPITIYFSQKHNMHLGVFSIIINTTKYIPKLKNTVNLPLNTRFFLLYYYINNISEFYNINTITDLLNNISYIDSINCNDSEGDIIMYPNDLVKN